MPLYSGIVVSGAPIVDFGYPKYRYVGVIGIAKVPRYSGIVVSGAPIVDFGYPKNRYFGVISGGVEVRRGDY